MTIHVASVNNLATLPAAQHEQARAGIVKLMADHLVAAMMCDALDIGDDAEVIDCLLNTPEQFRWSVIRTHLDDALLQAKQTLIERAMAED